MTTSANDKVSLTKYDFPFNAFSNTLTDQLKSPFAFFVLSASLSIYPKIGNKRAYNAGSTSKLKKSKYYST